MHYKEIQDIFDLGYGDTQLFIEGDSLGFVSVDEKVIKVDAEQNTKVFVNGVETDGTIYTRPVVENRRIPPALEELAAAEATAPEEAAAPEAAAEQAQAEAAAEAEGGAVGQARVEEAAARVEAAEAEEAACQRAAAARVELEEELELLELEEEIAELEEEASRERAERASHLARVVRQARIPVPILPDVTPVLKEYLDGFKELNEVLVAPRLIVYSIPTVEDIPNIRSSAPALVPAQALAPAQAPALDPTQAVISTGETRNKQTPIPSSNGNARPQTRSQRFQQWIFSGLKKLPETFSTSFR